ncbi:MAG: PfkB family carbohydrate kinase, partial [Rhodospirillales bacterium]|nr:PfkB family carbohydrate kinase [Rhodospirillales bacterium]
TITADAFVRKGPGRPVFSEHMRAEFLSELDCVDYVGIVHDPLSVQAIRKVKPAVYAKGSDYRNADDDVTGGIIEERAAVEKHGGRIVFTDDITYSSTSLINRHLAVFEPTLDQYLEAQRDQGLLDELLELIDRISGFRVLMIGDAIIDDYRYVSAIGKSPKEHMIATLFDNREVFAGGVFAAANHVAGFCKEVELITTIGDDAEYEKLIRDSLKPNVRLQAFRRRGKPTTRKTRFIDRGYLRKMFEVYHMDDTPVPPPIESKIEKFLRDKAADFDLVIVTDFGHGLISSSLIGTLRNSAKFLAVTAQSISANMGYNLITRYPSADYICIDMPEARLAVSDRQSDPRDIVGQVLPARIDCPRFIVTHGMNGCVGYQRDRETIHVPAFTKTVVDTVGAGDAFFSVTSPIAAAGGAIDRVAFIGNAAGAIKVGIVGHRSAVERVALIKFLNTLLK